MSYSPVTDFLGIVRQLTSGVQIARMPGLDYVVAAMSRAGMFALSVGQTAPTANQATTVWLRPALPSWTAEGNVFLWNPGTAAYELATPALWAIIFAGSPYQYQAAAATSNVVNPGTSLLAVTRAAPVTTTLSLPSIASRLGKALQIVDWSTGFVTHGIQILPKSGETIMKQAQWNSYSTADQLAGVTLQPSADLSAWVIAP